MIDSIKVKNFQSLHDVELEFGRFTVIVGPSSSGKSAIIRALKAISSNSLASDYITRNTKNSSISVKSDNTTITIEREQGVSSVYKIAHEGSQVQVFTKLNRSVPAEVTKALGISPSSQEVESINFAGQFDAPYLLKDSASTVARVLGELTNVSTIFAAVKEASRRAKAASTLVNIRKKDEEKLLKEVISYSNIGKKSSLLKEAKKLMSSAQQLNTDIGILNDLIDIVDSSDTVLQVEHRPIPDIDNLTKAYNELNLFKTTLQQIVMTSKEITEQATAINEYRQNCIKAETELHNTLVSVGRCPTCNQKILEE